MLEALQRGAAHESLVCCAAYLLGEYGRQVQQVPLRDQFALLQERFVTVSSEAKVIASSQLFLKVSCLDQSCCVCECTPVMPLRQKFVTQGCCRVPGSHKRNPAVKRAERACTKHQCCNVSMAPGLVNCTTWPSLLQVPGSIPLKLFFTVLEH